MNLQNSVKDCRNRIWNSVSPEEAAVLLALGADVRAWHSYGNRFNMTWRGPWRLNGKLPSSGVIHKCSTMFFIEDKSDEVEKNK